jgi:hypothetical protein
VPVAGPFISLASRRYGCQDGQFDTSSIPTADDVVNHECFQGAVREAQLIGLLAADGLVQTVGMALLLIGLADRELFLVRTDLAKLQMGPRHFGSGRYGLQVRGSF